MAGNAYSSPLPEIKKLLQVVSALRSTQSVSHICEIICRAVVELSPTEHASIVSINDAGTLQVEADYPVPRSTRSESSNASIADATWHLLVDSVNLPWVASIRESLGRAGVRGDVIVPITNSSHSVRVLLITGATAHISASLYGDLWQLLASLASTALDSSQSHAKAEEVTVLNALLSASLAVAEQVQRDTLLRTILEKAVNLLQARSGGIYVLDAEKGTLTLEVEHGSPRPLVGTVLKIGEGLAGRLIEREDNSEIVDDYRTWKYRSQAFAGDDFFCCVLEIQLRRRTDQKPLGVIYVERSDRKFDLRDVRKLELLVEPAAVALVNSAQIEDLQRKHLNLTLLFDSIERITSAATPSDGLQALCELLLDFSDVQFCQVLILDDVGRSLLIKATAARDGKSPKDTQRFVVNRWQVIEECFETKTHYLLTASGDPQNVALQELGQTLFNLGDFSSLLLVPLKTGRKTIGLLSLGDKSPDIVHFTSAVIDNVIQIAIHTAVQIDRVRQYEIEERRRSVLQRLDDVAVSLRGEREIQTLRKEIVNQAATLVGWTAAALYVNRHALQRLDLTCTAGQFPICPADRLRHSDLLVGEVVQTRTPKLIIRSEKAHEEADIDLEGMYAKLVLPLKSFDGKVTHVLLVAHDGEGAIFLQTDRELLARFASRAAMALQIASVAGAGHRTVEFLNFLERFSSIMQQVNTLDAILHALLTGITAGYGLSFNRAALFMLNEQGTFLQGSMAIGHIDKAEAEREWARDRSEYRFDLESYFDLLTRGAVLPRTPLNDRVGKVSFDITTGGGGALNSSIRSMVFDVLPIERLSELPREIDDLLTPCTDVVLAPVIVRKNVIGILIADNKFTAAPITDDLLNNLQAFVNVAAVAIDKNSLLEATHKTHAQMSALFAASNSLITPSLDDVARTTLAATGSDSVSVILIEKERAIALVTCGTDKGMNVSNVIRPNGISIAVVRRGSAECIQETRGQESRLNPLIYKDDTRAALCLPLRVQGSTIGVMWIHYIQPRVFKAPDVEAIQLYVNQAAISYARARQVQELEAFQKAIERITAASQYSEVIDAIVAAIRELLRADTVTIWPYDEATDKFITDKAHAAGLEIKSLEEPRRGGTTYAVLNQDYLAVDDLSTFRAAFAHPPHTFLDQHQIKSYQAVVLTAGSEKVGVLYANYCTRRYFSDDDRRLLMRLSPYSGLALKKALLNEQVERVESAALAFVDIMAINDLGRTLAGVATELRKTTDCDAVMLYSYDEETKTIGHPPTIVGVNEPGKARRHRIPDNSIIYDMVRADGPVIVERVSEVPAFADRRFAKEEGIHSVVATPLRVAGRRVGVVFVNYRTQHRFTESDIKNIDLFANQAAVAIRNAQTIGKFHQQQVLDWVCAAARKALGGDLCNIVLPNEMGGLFFAAVDGWPASLIGYQLPAESHAATVFGQRRRVIVPNFGQEHRFKPPSIAAEFGIVSGIGVPMFRGDLVIGAMLMHFKSERKYTDSEIDYLQTLANQTAAGITGYGAFAGVKHTGDRLRAVSAVSEALMGSAATDRPALLAELLIQATQHVTDGCGKKAVLATLQEYDAATHTMKFVAVYPPDAYPDLVGRLGERRDISENRMQGESVGVTGRCALMGESQLVANVSTDLDYVEFHQGTISEIVVPLIFAGGIKGVVNLESDREAAFDSDDVSTLEAIAKVGVLAIERLTLTGEKLDIKRQLQSFREAVTNSLLAAGHDLRTPLATIKGNAEMLLKGEYGQMSEGALSRLRVMLDETDAELRIATNLCETVRIHEGKPELDRQMRDISELARAIETRFLSVAGRQNTVIRTRIEAQITLLMDERIELVFTNLMDNALRALRSRGGTITLTVQDNPNHVICSVEDTGPGIPANEVPRVFERFYSSDKYLGGGGLGIGLSVSKYFVEQHNGVLWVDSNADPTRFSFKLPK